MDSDRINVMLIIFYVIFFLVGPIIVIPYHHSKIHDVQNNVQPSSCSADQLPIYFSPGKTGAILRIHSDTDLTETRLPDIRLSDFKRDTQFSNIEFKAALQKISSPATLIVYTNLHKESQNTNGGFAVVKGELLPAKSDKIFSFCVDPNSVISTAKNLRELE